MDFEVILGYLTGLRFLTDSLPLSTLAPTAVLIHLIDGIMCRLLARNKGYPMRLWAVLGFVFGMWALLILFFLPKKKVISIQ